MSKFIPLGVVAAIVFLWGAGISHADDAGPIAVLPWLHEGTVLNYYKHAAIAPGKPFSWKQNDDGDWIDPSTGKSYDKITNYGTSAPMISQTRVLFIEGNTVGIDTLTFGLEQNLGFADPVLQAAIPPEVTDVTSNSYWKSPAILAAATTDGSRGILVTRCTWPFGDHKVDAVRIQITKDSLYQMEIYDLKSGLCLHVASAFRSGPDKDTTITRSDLLRVRDLKIPWADEPIPDAAVKLDAMHFVGQIKKGGPFASLPPQAVTIDFTTKDHGRRWIRFDTRVTLSGLMVATPPFLFGPGEYCGLWIGPKAAKSFQAGQVLDVDPDTKMKTVVSKVTGRGVEITASNNSSGHGCVYDLTTGMESGWAEYDGPTQTSQLMRRKVNDR